jgi:phosphoribosylformimino-5-aminoimidazole carboxamide ribotide isomerase
MDIFPAIDLKNGQCVRLTQGDFDTAKIYEADPVLQAQKFAAAGAAWLHMVDLDGAKAGEMRQFDVIAALAKQTPLKIQVGGGIRDAAIIQKLLDAGIKRVVIGSLAVKEPKLVQSWLKQFGPDKIVLAFDVKLNANNDPEILTHGWQAGSNQSLWDVLKEYSECGLETILCTDVSRDGMLAGANNQLYQTIQQRWPKLNILASGGVSNLSDLIALSGLGLTGAIVGKAIYENRIDLADAIKQVQNAG